MKETVIDELLEMGLVDSPAAIAYAEIGVVPTGQIVYDLNRRDVLRRVNRFLDQHGVIRVGRYSEWKYLMSDACVLGGRRAARQLKEMHGRHQLGRGGDHRQRRAGRSDRQSGKRGDEMNLMFDSRWSDDRRRAGLYAGDIFVISALPSAMGLVERAREAA